MTDHEHVADAVHGDRILTDSQQLDDATQKCFHQAERRLLVRAVRLELPYFRSVDMAGQVERLIAAGRHNRLQLLIEEASHFFRHNARLVDLCRRFSSYIEVRELAPEYSADKELFVVVDQSGFLHQPRIDIPRGVTNDDDPAAARKLMRRFEDVWQHAAPMAGIFTLGL